WREGCELVAAMPGGGRCGDRCGTRDVDAPSELRHDLDVVFSQGSALEEPWRSNIPYAVENVVVRRGEEGARAVEALIGDGKLFARLQPDRHSAAAALMIEGLWLGGEHERARAALGRLLDDLPSDEAWVRRALFDLRERRLDDA